MSKKNKEAEITTEKINPIYFVLGPKGGVGKTTTAIGLIDYLSEKGETPIVIDADTRNTDLYKTFVRKADGGGIVPREGIADTKTFNLDIQNGWAAIVDYLDAHRDSPIVINTGYGTKIDYFAKVGLLDVPEIMDRVVILWIADEVAECIIQLAKFAEDMPEQPIHIVLNLDGAMDNDRKQFSAWDNSTVKKKMIALGGIELEMPVAGFDTKKVTNERKTLREIAEQSGIGTRMVVNGWRKELRKMFDKLPLPGEGKRNEQG